MVKAVTLFLVVVAVLAMMGRLRLPRIARRDSGADKPPRPRKCPSCGAFQIGRGPCPCGRGDGRRGPLPPS